LGQISSLTARQSPGNRLDIQASPNPTNNYVNLAIRGEIKNTVTVSILDVFGQVVEKHDRIASNSVLKVGETWKNGIYFAVVVQGDQRKIIKIIKAN
jgi:hypothetical protein